MSSTGAGRKRTDLLAYAVPNFAVGALMIPAGAMMPNIYAKHTGVALASIGVAFIILNVIDAFTDQLVGFASDRTSTRWGSRKPWMIIGAPMIMVGMYFLYIPHPDVTIIYFFLASLLLGFGYTCVQIPYVAWGAELTGDYRERSRVFMFHSIAGQSGGLLLFAAPLILYASGVLNTTEFGPEQIRYITYAGLLLLPVVLVVAMIKAPVGQVVQTVKRPGLLSLVHSISGNKPFLRFILVFFIAVIGHGSHVTLLVMMAESYYGIGDKLPYIFIATATIQILAIYPWMLVLRRVSKHRAWSASWIASAIILPCLALIEPGPQSLWPVMLILGLQALVESVSNFVAPAIMGDIVDYDTMKSGSDNAGNYFGLFNVMIKASAALGGGLAFIVLGFFEYNVREPSLNGDWQKFGMIFAAMLLPAALKFLCALLLWNFPLDERRHGIIRRRIEQRAARLAEA